MLNLQAISNQISYQFPEFMRTDGPGFIEFVKTYYEWMEGTGNPVDLTRSMSENFDLDTTLDSFLSHYENMYLVGIPDTVSGDKRFLIKHILNLYRSKGTIQGYKLLFRLLYNEEIDIYLPSRDMFTLSDNTWYEPQYLEVTENDANKTYVGQRIRGTSSGTEAIVESFITSPIDMKLVNQLYISSVDGPGFQIGEKIVGYTVYDASTIINAPTILGSLGEIDIVYGGESFSIGDILVQKSGIGDRAQIRVASIGLSNGGIRFTLDKHGRGYSNTANIILTRQSPYGSGANVSISALTSVSPVTYDTMLLRDLPQTLSSYGNAILSTLTTFTTKTFGSIAGLTAIQPGTGYRSDIKVDVKDFIYSANLQGKVFFSNTSNILVGSNTKFGIDVQPSNYICLKSANGSMTDYRKVVSIQNTTTLTLDDVAAFSAANTNYQYCVPLWDAIASPKERIKSPDFTLTGNNAVITAQSSAIGSGVIGDAIVKSSGLGYNDGDKITFVKTNVVGEINIIQTGSGYANNDPIAFDGGIPSRAAYGYVTTDVNGSVTGVSLVDVGSSYISVPKPRIVSKNGTGAIITCSINGTDNTYIIQGIVKKVASGKEKGRWLNNRGFASSDKRLQDSYYYQQFSYEINSSQSFDRYVEVIKRVYHPSGLQLFGKVINTDMVSSNTTVVSESITLS